MIKRILGNTIWITIGQGLGKFVAFLLMIFIARYLGDELYGQFSFAISLVGILVLFGDAGLGAYITRELAKHKDLTKQYIGQLITLKIFLSLLTFGLIFLCLFLLGKDPVTRQLTYIAALYVVGIGFVEFFFAVFRAWEKMKYEAITKIVYNLCLFAIGMAFILLNLSAQALMSAYVIATLIAFIVSYSLIKKYFTGFKLGWDTKFWKMTLKRSWPFALSSIFVVLYFKIDTVMLSAMRTDAEVGWYNAAYNLVFALIMIPTIFDIIFYPILSKTFGHKKEFTQVVNKIFSYAVLIAVPVAIFVYLIRGPLVEWIYAGKYDMAIPILGILVWSFMLNLINRFPFILNAANLAQIITFQAGLGVLLNVGLNFILIPNFGTIGAAWATVATEVLAIAVLTYFGLYRYRKLIFSSKSDHSSDTPAY
ncbi:flippase [Patescibacteria group bacterium]|nr:flippase [Patescibacteria group bacterium]MBU1673250.1 flippase [Patescibacteria group bacterium]MBU1963511.1 flippase [Patescibacteria group bacterium]